jgi:hypothetical protein
MLTEHYGTTHVHVECNPPHVTCVLQSRSGGVASSRDGDRTSSVCGGDGVYH